MRGARFLEERGLLSVHEQALLAAMRAMDKEGTE